MTQPTELIKKFRQEYREAYKNVLPEEVLKDGNQWFEERILSAYAAGRESGIEVLSPWVEHSNECILSRCTMGEPTPDGGYRQKFGGKWYETRPVDKTPKCDCGLDVALSPTPTKIDKE